MDITITADAVVAVLVIFIVFLFIAVLLRVSKCEDNAVEIENCKSELKRYKFILQHYKQLITDKGDVTAEDLERFETLPNSYYTRFTEFLIHARGQSDLIEGVNIINRFKGKKHE
jgi:hypothetical protein